MKITPTIERYILHWGEMGTRWGVNRTVAQVHALLYLSPQPLNAEQIAELLSIARSNVSTSIRELQSWNLINVVQSFGDRRDYFSAKSDTWDLLLTILEERKKREMEPTLNMLRQCVQEMENDRDTAAEIKQKIQTMLDFVSALSEWLDQVKALPKSTLIKLLKMGAKVAKLLGN